MQAAVLTLLAQGRPNRKIAHCHPISLASVHTHAGQILAKMGVHSRVRAALLAVGIESRGEAEED